MERDHSENSLSAKGDLGGDNASFNAMAKDGGVRLDARDAVSNTAYILSLDEGLLHKICSSLATADLLSAQCTCRQLHKFIEKEKELWKRLTFPDSVAQRATDARLAVLVARAGGALEALELKGSRKVTGTFLLTEPMKSSRLLQKLWLLECPNLSSAAVLSLVGHIVQMCSKEGLTPCLSSIRLAGSNQVYSRHVHTLERLLLPARLDVTACPNCPKAGRVTVCRMVSLLESLSQGEGQATALVRGGEIGCESCLVRCVLCRHFYCSGHLFDLPCGISGVCCMCCGAHQCLICEDPSNR